MLNNEKYLSKFVMTKSGKVDITISRTDGQKITPNEQGAICRSVNREFGMAEVEEVIPNIISEYELLELRYMKAIGYRIVAYDKRLKGWEFSGNDNYYAIMGKVEYTTLEKNRDYGIDELLLAQNKCVVIVPKGVNK